MHSSVDGGGRHWAPLERMLPGTPALFFDWGGTLALSRDNHTVTDDAGNPVLMPNVAETLARVRPSYGIGRPEITEAEVVRRFVGQSAAG